MFNRITILIMLLCTFPLCAIAGTIQLPKTGQTTSYVAGDDGDLEWGVAWPGQRFTDNGNGTVTDNLTRLIWLKDANCFGTQTWANAISSSNSLASGACDLTDGSHAGDWRLPNRKELRSLVDYSRYNPALPGGHPFTKVQADLYWSSSSYVYATPFNAWVVNMWYGYVGSGNKYFNVGYVWPVRAGQSGSLGNLIIHFSGTGSGTVSGNGVRNGNPVSFSNYVETEQFDIGTTVNLHGEPSEYSFFTGWPACGGAADCGFTMTAILDLTANFDFYTAHKTRIGDTSIYRSTLQEAYDDSPNLGTVKAWATDFSEELTCAKTKDVTLKGGYNGGYTSNTGYSTLQGKLTLQSGSLTVENLLIK